MPQGHMGDKPLPEPMLADWPQVFCSWPPEKNSYQGVVKIIYRKVFNIRRTKSQNLNVSRLILQLSLPNPLKPGVKLRMKM